VDVLAGSDGTVTITGDLGVSAERMLESKTQVKREKEA